MAQKKKKFNYNKWQLILGIVAVLLMITIPIVQRISCNNEKQIVINLFNNIPENIDSLNLITISPEQYSLIKKYSEEILKEKKDKARNYLKRSYVEFIVGNYRQAIYYAEQAIEIVNDNDILKSIALHNIGTNHIKLGNIDEAYSFLNKALNINNDLQRISGIVNNNTSLAEINYIKGEYDLALKRLNENLTLTIQFGDKKSEAMTLTNIAVIYNAQGEYEEALDNNERALEIIKTIEDTSDVQNSKANILNNIGEYYKNIGDFKNALKYYNDSLLINREINDKQSEANNLSNIGYIYYLQSKEDDALK